jgi:NTE family protein
MTADSQPGGVFVGSADPKRSVRAILGLRPKSVPTKTAFVLAGGGTRGAAQVGMLAGLVSHGIRPDVVFGSSVGAVNSAGFVADPTSHGVERMATIWRGLTSEDVFPHGRVPAPWRFLQQRESVHPNDGLRRVIQNGAGIDRFEDALIPFEVVATSLGDGREKWFSSGSLTEAVLASAALPSLLPPVRIDGGVYIDGGVVDNVPITRAIEQGCNRIFVLLCGPLHYKPAVPRRPVEALLTAFFIAVHTRFARERLSLPPGVEVIVFCVGTDPISRYDDFSATASLIESGKANAEAVLAFWEAGGRGEIGVVSDPEGQVRGDLPAREPLAEPNGRVPKERPQKERIQKDREQKEKDQKEKVSAPPA